MSYKGIMFNKDETVKNIVVVRTDDYYDDYYHTTYRGDSDFHSDLKKYVDKCCSLYELKEELFPHCKSDPVLKQVVGETFKKIIVEFYQSFSQEKKEEKRSSRRPRGLITYNSDGTVYSEMQYKPLPFYGHFYNPETCKYEWSWAVSNESGNITILTEEEHENYFINHKPEDEPER